MKRVAFYSHDGYGLGHVRRSLLLASAAVKLDPTVETLVVTGSSRASFFDTLPRTRVVKLPAVTKDGKGRYISHNDDRPLDATVRDRKRILRREILDFAPDVMVVDHTPLGLQGELLPLLPDLKRSRSTQIVLGLRDIIDEPERVRKSWNASGVYGALEHLYDALWVYGSPEVFELAKLYDLPEHVSSKLSYLGYLGRTAVPVAERGGDDRVRLLCLVGGGGDGDRLARTFVEMFENCPPTWRGTVVTGPYLSHHRRRRLAALAAETGRVHLLRFTTGVEVLVSESDGVVTMGGYNSVLECLAQRRPTLVVPRTHPRREQWLRAQAFERLGLLHCLDPADMNAEELRRCTHRILDQGSEPASPPDAVFDGVRCFSRSLSALLNSANERKVIRDAPDSIRRRA